MSAGFCLIAAIPRRQSFKVQTWLEDMHRNECIYVHINDTIVVIKSNKQMSISKDREFSFSGERTNAWMSYKRAGYKLGPIDHITTFFLSPTVEDKHKSRSITEKICIPKAPSVRLCV